MVGVLEAWARRYIILFEITGCAHGMCLPPQNDSGHGKFHELTREELRQVREFCHSHTSMAYWNQTLSKVVSTNVNVSKRSYIPTHRCFETAVITRSTDFSSDWTVIS